MRRFCVIALAALVSLVVVPDLLGQHLRGVGEGPSTSFGSNLPSERMARTLGYYSGFTTARSFFGGVPGLPQPTRGYRPILVDLREAAWRPLAFGRHTVGPGVPPAFELRVRTLDSLKFDRRARFAKLRETMLALAERIRELEEPSLGQVGVGFRQLMFPVPLQEDPALGYGFFSRLDLVGGGTVDPELLLSPFTHEVQQSLGEARFLDAAAAMLFDRPLPDGMGLDQFYDSQLAALGNYLFNNRRYGRAVEVWALLVERDKTSAARSRALALCLLADRRLRGAAAEARRSFTLAPGWPDHLRVTGSNLQDIFPSTQDLVDAREEIEAQLAKQPDDPDLNFVMAYLDLFQGNWPAAENRLGKMAETDEVAQHLLAYLKAGVVADTVRRPALSALRRVGERMTGLEEPPLSPEARGQLIVALRRGAASYEEHMRVGDFRFFMGDFTLAGEAYRAAHKARPEDPFALFALTHAAFANGEYRTTERLLETALALEPNWGLYEFRIQEFYGEREEYDRHMANLERLVELRPSSTSMKFLLAYVYYFSGRYADAAELLAEILRMKPDFGRADYFLRLARLQG